VAELTKKELEEFYERVTESPRFRVYATLSQKLNQVCDAFDREEIDVREDSEVFNNLMKFVDKISKTLAAMDEAMERINPTKAKELKEQQKAQNTASVEAYVFGNK
jgi:hypothetical protein